MPTIVDSLIVELGLDPSQYTKGQKDVLSGLGDFKNKAGRAAKETEGHFKEIADGFESMARKAIGYVTAIVGIRSLAGFAESIVQANRTLGIMADVTQENIERLSTLGGVFQRLGGSSENVLSVISDWDKQLKGMEAHMLNPNDSSLIKFLNSLSAPAAGGHRIRATDAAGNWRKASDIFIEISEKMAKSNARKDLKVGLLRGAGLDDETIAVVLRGGDAMREYLKEQENIYKVTEDQRKQTDELNKQWQTLIQRTMNLGQVALVGLAKGLNDVYDVMKKFIEFLNEKLTDPKSILYLPSIARIKEYFESKGGGAGSGAGGGGSGGSGGAPSGGGVSGKGAMGGTVHGHPVDALGGLAGQKVYEPMTGTMGGGVGGHSAMFGPGQHEGVDIMGPVGSPVYAVRPGKVIRAPRQGGGLDQVLIIDHGDGTFSRYLHQGPGSVNEGDPVQGGQQVGTSGRRGAPHTHFEMWRGKPSGSGSTLLNPKAIFGWDKNNPAVGGREVTAGGTANDTGGWPVRPAAMPMPPFMNLKPMSLTPPNVTTNSKTEVGSVNVHTQATDAAAIAGDIANELKKQMGPSQMLINARNPAEAQAAMAEAARQRAEAEAR